MPTTLPAQKKLMLAIDHGWHPPASSGIHVPVSVAHDFVQADKRVGRIGSGKTRPRPRDDGDHEYR
jgi:hypothetical protein